ncbi:MAG: HAD-IC family P-type ATPase, partial [Candidatus Veblenbacteria bacterium]|nr:HAD-IC family P-type ATPase [Candidatus Veblenbacteria bacterium]
MDKTGTLTAGEMRVVRLVTPEGEARVGMPKLEDDSATLRLLRVGVLSSHAYLENPKDSLQQPVVVGNPTERALVLAGQEAGLDVEGLRRDFPLLAEVPFSSERKYMLTLHQAGKRRLAYLKGAPERVLAHCSHFRRGTRRQRLTEVERKRIGHATEALSRQGLRLLLLAEAELIPQAQLAELGSSVEGARYTYLGFVALQDPLRPEVASTVALARRAGLRVVMITGDHKLTAQAIAREVGLPSEGDNVIDGSELQNIDDASLRERVLKVAVYARAVPSDKLRIISAWQARGEVVAMTGDGVNDAPALKAADIGVALGSGSDVAKEASDMVLLDDNFTSIVAAVEEGRTIFQNIRKVVLYLVSDSFSEVILMSGAFIVSLMAGEPLALPILATQILWINFVSDTFPAIALASDPPNAAVMRQAPIPRNEPILDSSRRGLVALVSLTKG